MQLIFDNRSGARDVRVGAWLLIMALLMGAPAASAAAPGAIRFIPFPADSRLENSNQMMFIPGKGGPKIWVFGKRNYEFDPKTDEWRNLGSTLEEFDCPSEQGGLGCLDEFRPNLVWLRNFPLGVLRFDTVTGKSDIVPATSLARVGITSVAPDKDRIWIGTFQGLFSVDPKGLAVTKIPALTGVRVWRIGIEAERVWINGEFALSKKDMRVEQIYSRPGWPMSKVESLHLLEGYKFFASTSASVHLVVLDPGDRLVAQIDNVAAKYATKGASGIWLSGPNFISLFDLESQAFKERYEVDGFPGPVFEVGNQLLFKEDTLARIDRQTGAVTRMTGEDFVRQFVPRPDGYWLLTTGGLKVIPPESLEEAFASDTDPALQQVEDKAIGLSRLLGKGRLASRIKAAAEMLEIVETYPRMQWILSSVYAVLGKGGTGAAGELAEVEALLGMGTPNERALACHALLIHAFSAGDPGHAQRLLVKLQQEHPGSQPLSWLSTSDREMIGTAARGLSELEGRNLPEDEKLWLKANLFFDTMGVYWNVREGSFWDASLSTQCFMELIKRFPSSRFAALAEYKMLNFDESSSHEGGDNSWNGEAIKRYRAFLAKYPQSDLTPEIELKIATLYFQSLYPEEESRAHDFRQEAEPLALAQQAAERVVKVDKGGKPVEEARELIAAIELYRSRISWSLTIKADKERYSSGESVVIHLAMRNLDARPHEITISGNPKSPSCSIDLITYSGDQEERFERPKFVRELPAVPLSSKKIVVSANETHRESFDLTRHVRPDGFAAGSGRFVLDRPGRYVLTAFFPVAGGMTVVSNEVTFTVD